MPTYPETLAPRLLQGRLAFVTGAGQGNGRAFCLGLAQAGARIVATDMNAAAVEETARLVREAGGQAWSFALDVTSPEACRDVAQQVAAQIGEVDLLVNNAGIIIRETTASPRAAENFRKTLDVNVHGTFNVTHALLDSLKATRGCIVNMASIAAYAKDQAWPPRSATRRPRAPSRCSRSRWRRSSRPSACASTRWRPASSPRP
jgi:NAD(P)-dependent dehydrogenase (short-subunit alcohol dehydrogenase family)